MYKTSMGAVIELFHYRQMSEQAELFLKSELAQQAEKSLRKILFEIPVGILITKFRSAKDMKFHNE